MNTVPLDTLTPRDLIVFQSSENDRQKFWRHVDISGNCWKFLGGKGDYGRFVLKGQGFTPYRFAKIITDGPPPRAKMLACHICTEKRCVRPSHLYWGTQAENRADQWRDDTAKRPSLQGSKNHSAKISITKAAVAYLRFHRDGISCKKIAEELGISPTAINDIVCNKTWTHATSKLRETYFSEENLGPRRGERNVFSKLSDTQAVQIFKMIFDGIPAHKIADQFQISRVLVTRMKTGQAWKHLAPPYILRSIKPPRKRIALKPEDRFLALADLRQGATTQAIQEKYGVSQTTAYNLRSEAFKDAPL